MQQAYQEALGYLATGANEFYRLLGQGTMKAAAQYGGAEFACVLGQEMAGYATGEVFFVSQALGFRSSHLDAGRLQLMIRSTRIKMSPMRYNFLKTMSGSGYFLTSMVSCLFARNVYTPELLAQCLNAVGYQGLPAQLMLSPGAYKSCAGACAWQQALIRSSHDSRPVLRNHHLEGQA